MSRVNIKQKFLFGLNCLVQGDISSIWVQYGRLLLSSSCTRNHGERPVILSPEQITHVTTPESLYLQTPAVSSLIVTEGEEGTETLRQLGGRPGESGRGRAGGRPAGGDPGRADGDGQEDGLPGETRGERVETRSTP